MVNTQSPREYEKILFRYSSALDRGDFETVEAILQQAEKDARLEQMILEINDMYILIMEKQTQAEKQPKSNLPTLRSWLMGSWMGYAAAAILVVSIIGLVGLAFSSARRLGGYQPSIALLPEGTALPAPTEMPQIASTPEMVGAIPAATVMPYFEVTPLMPDSTGDMGYYRDATPLPTADSQATIPPLTTTPVAVLSLPTPTAASSIEAPPTGGTTQVPAQPQERMIVKNGEIDLLVKDAGAAIDQVTQIAADNGGYVLSSQSSLDGSARYATLTIAVQADMFETAMRRLRQSAIKVLRELATGQDVSTEYVDLQSRQRNLEATRDRIKSFLDQATTVQEALEINRQLADIEAQIEQVKGRMTYLSGRSAFSTITVNVQEQIDATPTPTPTATPTPTPTAPWSIGPTIERATETQVSMGRGLLEMVMWLLIVPGPYLAAMGIVAGIIWAINRRKGEPPRKSPQSDE